MFISFSWMKQSRLLSFLLLDSMARLFVLCVHFSYVVVCFFFGYSEATRTDLCGMISVKMI